MAFRYRKRHIDSNDVMDPRDWNLNHSNYAGEFNGYLDRDNFPADFVTQAMIQENCCNEVFSSTEGTMTGIQLNSVAWQAGGTDHPVGSLTEEIKSDALLICEWSGQWEWSYLVKGSGWGNVPNSSLRRDPTQAVCRFRLMVDGVVVAESGYSSARRKYDGCYLVGATPVSAGNHVVTVEAQFLYIEQNETILEANDLMRHGTYTVGDDDFSISLEEAELIVRARYR